MPLVVAVAFVLSLWHKGIRATYHAITANQKKQNVFLLGLRCVVMAQASTNHNSVSERSGPMRGLHSAPRGSRTSTQPASPASSLSWPGPPPSPSWRDFPASVGRISVGKCSPVPTSSFRPDWSSAPTDWSCRATDPTE